MSQSMFIVASFIIDLKVCDELANEKIHVGILSKSRLMFGVARELQKQN